MAKKTIQVADKPTLDAVKTLLEDNGYGLEVLKELLTSIDEKVSGSGSDSDNAKPKNCTYYRSVSGSGTNTPTSTIYGKGYLVIYGTVSPTNLKTFFPTLEIDGESFWTDDDNYNKGVPFHYMESIGHHHSKDLENFLYKIPFKNSIYYTCNPHSSYVWESSIIIEE